MKRKREKHITRLHIILFFLVIIVGLSIYLGITIKINNDINKYKSYEERIVKASKTYYKINQLSISEGYEKRLNISKLIDQGLVDSIDECKGYVLITSEKDLYSDDYNIEHRAYIKCGKKYATINYSEY